MWLINKGIINKKRRLLDYSKNDEIKLKENHQAAYSICIPPVLQDKMQNVLADIEVRNLFWVYIYSIIPGVSKVQTKVNAIKKDVRFVETCVYQVKIPHDMGFCMVQKKNKKSKILSIESAVAKKTVKCYNFEMMHFFQH